MDKTEQVRPSCGKCVCWQRVEAVGTLTDVRAASRGECHRFPPQLVGSSQGIGAGFPQTKSEDWCAEFHFKPGESPLNG